MRELKKKQKLEKGQGKFELKLKKGREGSWKIY